jgi:hypothetical protein
LILDLLSLLTGSVAIYSVRNPTGFRLAVFVGVVLALVCWYGCYAYTRLWNRRFHVKPIHHVLCALAALITLGFSVLYPALAYVREAGEASIASWEATVNRDGVWAATTFRTAYQAVRKLGIEDFKGVPEPGAVQSWIPTSHDESRQTAAGVYASSACNHFSRSRPFLSKLVWARPGIPTEVVFADVRRWHRTNPNYPPERAIELAVEQIRAGLVAQVPRIVALSRILTIILFLLAQAVPFGLVGWAAYRDIQVRT